MAVPVLAPACFQDSLDALKPLLRSRAGRLYKAARFLTPSSG